MDRDRLFADASGQVGSDRRHDDRNHHHCMETMTTFILYDADRTRLRVAADRARAKPVPWEILKRGVTPNQETHELTLADREGIPVLRDPEQVMLPGGWRVAITCEEQPAGILLHVSMSSPAEGKVPVLRAMEMIVEACGFSPVDIARVWLEEYEPNKRAVNVLVMVAQATDGSLASM